MIYLVEFDTVDPETGAVTRERFGTEGYTTAPSDDPANVHFEGRIIDPGNFERTVFSDGRTSGQATVGAGYVELAIADGGLDYIASRAVDGRPVMIWGLASATAAWSSRVLIMRGTSARMDFGWRRARLIIRDRLAELAENMAAPLYAGTTIAGGMNEAEGTPDDLKDKGKPALWGRALNLSPVLANSFDLIWQISDKPLRSIETVRDQGVPLTFHADYPTIAALRTATIPAGRYGTALALGLMRTPVTPSGDITVDATEGTDGNRSAARTAWRILEANGFDEGEDFLASDLDDLHAANPAEVGIWTGSEQVSILSVVSQILDSVGAYIVPDRLGMFRIRRVEMPSIGGPILDQTVLLDAGEGLERLSSGDETSGVPAWKVTVRYARNYTVLSRSMMDETAASEAFKTFATEAFRNAVSEDADIKDIHLLSDEVEFDTLLLDQAAASGEATRRLGIYGARRERYRLLLKSEEAAALDLGETVTLAVNRFGMQAGKPFIIVGIVETLALGRTELQIFG